MHHDHAELHGRIQAFNFDHVNGQVTFTQHLAREHHWPKGYAERVIGEYRKFLLLAMITGHKVVPSDQVDQAWHLHLLNSRSYWQDLCPKVLGKDLHHRPNPGGKVEQARHLQDYNQTLDSYERIFGQKAPDDIWPPAEIRFGCDRVFVRVHRCDYWVIQKPILNRMGLLGTVAIVALLLLMTGCTGALINDDVFEKIMLASLLCLTLARGMNLLGNMSTLIFAGIGLLLFVSAIFLNAPFVTVGIILGILLLSINGGRTVPENDIDHLDGGIDDEIDNDFNDNGCGGCSGD